MEWKLTKFIRNNDKDNAYFNWRILEYVNVSSHSSHTSHSCLSSHFTKSYNNNLRRIVELLKLCQARSLGVVETTINERDKPEALSNTSPRSLSLSHTHTFNLREFTEPVNHRIWGQNGFGGYVIFGSASISHRRVLPLSFPLIHLELCEVVVFIYF